MSHTHTPIANAQISTSRNTASDRRGARYQYIGNATSVPNVPGALLARPLPKPNARKCAGWLNKNRQSALRPGSGQGFASDSPEVIITAGLHIDKIARRIVHDAAAPRNDVSDAGQRQSQPHADVHYFGMALRRR